MSKFKWLLSLALVVQFGCSEKIGQSDKDVFRFNIHAGFTSMDPAFARNQANIWVSNQIFDGLLQLNDNLEPVPCIAKSWEVDSSKTTYTFHLRQDVYFQKDSLFPNKKSRKVTARDFVYSFNRILKKETASPGAWIFNDKVYIREVNGVRKGSFKALNDSTLQIRLKEPFPPFLGLLTMQYCSVVPKKLVKHYGKDFRRNPVGTGPFKLYKFIEGERIILHKYEEYFGKSDKGEDLPFLDAVAIKFIPNKQNEFLAFLRGDLDFLSGIDGSFKDNLLTPDGRLDPKFEGQFRMQKIPYLNSEYLGIQMDSSEIDLSDNPLRKKKIRQAINYGFDRHKMLHYLRNNIGRPANNGLVPAGLPAFDTQAVDGYRYNPEKAGQLLREAGFPQGKGMPTIKLQTTQSYLDLCIFIEKQLANLGIPLKVEVVSPSMLREWMAQSKTPFFRGSWIADYPDAENYLALFYSKNFAPDGPNYTHFSNARFDSLYKASLRAETTAKRHALYHKMENLVMGYSPVIPLYYDEVVRLIQNDVKGLGRNAKNLIDLKNVKKVKESKN